MANLEPKTTDAVGIEACVEDLRVALMRANRALERIERLGMGLAGLGNCEVVAKPGLAEYEWRELKAIADKLAKCGREDDALDLAKGYGLVDHSGKIIPAVKQFSLNDGLSIGARLVSIRHDEDASGEKSGLTFLCTINDRVEMEASPLGYDVSTANYYLETLFEKKFPIALKEIVQPVVKGFLGRSYAEREDVFALWCVSVCEVFGAAFDDLPENTAPNLCEGGQFQLFCDAGVVRSTDRNELLKFGPSWTRSRCSFDEDMYWCITANGTPGCDLGSEELGLAFCFAL